MIHHKSPPLLANFSYPLATGLSFIMLLFFAPFGFAYHVDCCMRCWRPIIAIGGGYLSSNKFGQNQSFPIEQPVTDSFYNYAPNRTTKASGLVDGFLGIEWGLGSAAGAILQLGIGYNQAVPFTAKGTLTQGVDESSQSNYSYQYNITLSQLLFEAKLLASVGAIYHPYLFGGAGAAFNRANNYRTSVPASTSTREYASYAKTVFSYSVGFGLDVDLDQVFRVGVGYRYSNYGSVRLGDATIDNTPVTGTLSQSSLYTNEVLAQITYGFS